MSISSDFLLLPVTICWTLILVFIVLFFSRLLGLIYVVVWCVVHVLFSWAYLEVSTNPAHSDADQAYTAGLGEALLTSDLMKLDWQNTLEGYCTLPLSPYCQRLKKFIDTNAAWMQQQLDNKADVDPYWHQVASWVFAVIVPPYSRPTSLGHHCVATIIGHTTYLACPSISVSHMGS